MGRTCRSCGADDNLIGKPKGIIQNGRNSSTSEDLRETECETGAG
jgi:hypothetical protein